MSNVNNVRLKSKADLHLLRKIWHLSGVLTMFYVYNKVPQSTSWLLLGAVSLLVIPLDLLRQRHEGLNLFAQKVCKPLMRDQESASLTGATFLLAGTLVLLAFFPRDIVNISLLFLAFGDPFASYIGIKYGKDPITFLGGSRKTLQGFLGAFAICTTLAFFYYYHNNVMVERLFIVAPLSGFIGACAESVPIRNLDDNFTLPVVSASLLYVLFFMFGGLPLH